MEFDIHIYFGTGSRIREIEKVLQTYLMFEKKLIKKVKLHFCKKILKL